MFKFLRRALGANPAHLMSRTRKHRRIPLLLEELESRALLSAAPTGWIATPNLTVLPLNTNGTAPYSPAQIRHAYGFDQIALANGKQADGSGQTIAIIDAYDDPTIANDLSVFDKQFGIAPPPSFVKATPGGVTPARDAGWSGEIALDVEWAHAIAPGANILLVEATSASDADLLAAIDYARSQATVSVVSMSFGGGEWASESGYDSHFTTPAGHTGITFVASSGDSGAWYGVEWPAVSPNVLAVGGTSLKLNSTNTYRSESGWNGSGGGYSSYVSEPTYQRGVQNSGVRTSPDVSYDANPNTGFYVYDTTGGSGWYAVGGTSAGAPQWSALLALADQGRAVVGKGTLAGAQATVYSLSASDFHDVTGGGNGYSSTVGYDLVTGRGSPYADRVVRDLIATSNTTTFASQNTTGKSGTSGTLLRKQVEVADAALSVSIVTGTSFAPGTTQTFDTTFTDSIRFLANRPESISSAVVLPTEVLGARATDSAFTQGTDPFALSAMLRNTGFSEPEAIPDEAWAMLPPSDGSGIDLTENTSSEPATEREE